MSYSLTNVQQIEFDAQVKLAYQSMGHLLKNTVYTRSGVIGNSVDFRKTGYITAEESAYQSVIQAQDPGYDKVNCVLKKYNAKVLVDDVQQWTVNFDEMQYDARLVAAALGRRSDQIIINELNNTTTTNTVAAGGVNMNFEKVRQINEFFNDLAIPPEERHILITAKQERSLLNEQQVTNASFYVNEKILPKGTINGFFWMGMNWHVIPTMREGGLPKSGNNRTCFAYHMRSIGFGMRDFPASLIERIAEKDSWQIMGKIFGGSKIIDDTGIVKITCDESV